ncbi:MAG: hypothetical protein ABIQ15_13780 [Nocardioides sp.]
MGMSKEELRVAGNALNKESRLWSEEAPQLDWIETTLASMSLSRTEAGIFQIMYTAYEDCRSVVEGRAREGAAEFRLMGEVLLDISKAYQDADEAAADELAAVW